MARSYTRLGNLCLGIYLLVMGLVHLLGLSFPGIGILLGVLAIIAGVLLIAGRGARRRRHHRRPPLGGLPPPLSGGRVPSPRRDRTLSAWEEES